MAKCILTIEDSTDDDGEPTLDVKINYDTDNLDRDRSKMRDIRIATPAQQLVFFIRKYIPVAQESAEILQGLMQEKNDEK